MENVAGEVVSFLENLFLLKYLPDLGTNASYGLLFLFGLMTSFHCIGMCGGIAISQTIERPKDRKLTSNNSSHRSLISSSLYNLGRVISYTLVGGIIGGLGSVVGFSQELKGIVPILGGIFMIIMAINLLGIFPFLRKFNIRMPLFFAKKIRAGKNYNPLFIGLLSGLMPCGPLQIVELYALGTRSALFGAASMFFFSLGTVPILFALGIINSFISKNFSIKIAKGSAVLVLILGFVMIGRGLSLFGISSDLSAMVDSKHKETVAAVSGNIQTVTTELDLNSYEPIVVRKGIPVKWTIKATAENLTECNSTINISKFKIEKKLKPGDNLVEFTPPESGEISYSCWMGMIKSKIKVVDEIKK